MSKVIKGIKLRLYPNQSQREQLWQMFGNDRFVWNQMLGMAKERYQNNPNSLFVNEYGMNYLLTAMNRQAVIICHCRLKLRLISCLRLVSRSDWTWASPIW